jgi:hypothetical protein
MCVDVRLLAEVFSNMCVDVRLLDERVWMSGFWMWMSSFWLLRVCGCPAFGFWMFSINNKQSNGLIKAS